MGSADQSWRAHLHIVVMAGGSGTRFWPLSRRERPKQVLDLKGEGTLLASTFARIEPLVGAERWWMVVGEKHAGACRAAAPAVPAAHVLVEPRGRNTAPAVGLAAAVLLERDPDTIMVMLAADHFVKDAPAQNEALGRAAQLAQDGAIVTLGIEAAHPETGYGYIQRGDADTRVEGAYHVARFCEKPDLDTARRFVADGGYDWNAGIFVARAARFWEEIQAQLPATHDELAKVRRAAGTAEFGAVVAAAYEAIEPISLDYGIMEKAERVSVVPVSCGWSDVGALDAMGEVIDADSDGNITAGRALVVDSTGSVVYTSPDHLVAVLGVDDVVVVHTEDATLIIPRDQAQRVRDIVARIEERGWDENL